MPARVEILRSGLATPVGLGTEQTLASLEAGMPGFRGASVVDKRFEELTMALVAEEELPPLDPEPEGGWTARQHRMLRLGAVALDEVLGEDPLAAQVPLYLAGPELVPERPPVATPEWAAALATVAGVPLQLEAGAIFPFGRAGGLYALEAAIGAIESGAHERVLVGGVDTFLDLRLLAELDREGRVQTSSELDGFIPGEGAAFVLLGRPGANEKPLAAVHAAGSALEPGHRGSQEPYRGDGLAAAITNTLEAGIEGAPVETVLAGLNGESFGNKEWGVSFTRNQALINAEGPVVLPAESLGDTGAALAPLMLAMAAHGISGGTLKGPCLVWASADGPERGAAIVAA